MSTVNFKTIILMALSIGLSQNPMVADGCETVKLQENCLNPDCSTVSKNNAWRSGIIKLKILPSFTQQLSNSFDNLIDDPYLKSTFKFRRRSYSTGKMISNIFAWDECIALNPQNCTVE